ncbi:MAG: hypothetical protein U1G07_16010 [Verrucomicrobiota bacterium]
MRPTPLIALSGLLFTAASFAQSFAISDFIVTPADSTSQGGPFIMVGTVDVGNFGRLQGGNYVLSGDWQPAASAAVGDAPVLTVAYDAGIGLLTLSWPNWAGEYVLEECTALGNAPWNRVATLPTEAGSSLRLSIQPQLLARFYRLALLARP